MRVVRHIDESSSLAGSVVTLGNFDGVHRGHQVILDRVVAEGNQRGVLPVVITFYPHPTAVLAPRKAPPRILALRDRLAQFRERGIGLVWLQRFTRAFSKLEPTFFIEHFLIRCLAAQKVVIGHNVSFGRRRGGNAALLTEVGRDRGFEVEAIGPVRVGTEEVSSTRIREAVAEGDLVRAARLLGRPHTTTGRVMSGERRGRGLGFPTANIQPRIPLLAPDGVYAVRVRHPGGEVAGIANIGRTPTFGENRPRGVEVHLFDFDGDLYGCRIEVGLVERIRPERKFSSSDALVEQIRLDVARTRAILAGG